MKTNSSVKNQQSESTNQSGSSTDPSAIQKATDQHKNIPDPDYSSMEAAIEKISDPLTFDELKTFYRID